ncbi:MAG: superoxide dismutase, Ni [Dehalococcoidia bacterium]|nr:superoxide dismutase, Ni [Dehalococcoidia bacterium]
MFARQAPGTALRTGFALLNRLFPHEEASAHCDIPCGIYDPHLAQLAALTVVRMNQLIKDLQPPAMGAGGPPAKEDRDKYMNSLARYIATKEEHAELVKHEVRIIRGDFFKPENSPEGLGQLVDGIMKTASKARQNIDMEAAQELLNLTNQFAEAFWKAKSVATKKQSSNQAAGGEYVVPAN